MRSGPAGQAEAARMGMAHRLTAPAGVDPLSERELRKQDGPILR